MDRSKIFICIILVAVLGTITWSGAQEEPGERSNGPAPIVVIDPGHGGSDSGVQGPSKLLEKDLTLATANRLKEKLEGNLGLKVLLTRVGDYHVTATERAATANHNLAGLFISLHLGASQSQGADNFTVFFADRRPIEEDFLRGTSPLWRVWERQYEAHLKDSRNLASMLQAKLDLWLGNEPSQPLWAGIPVLVGTDCPAVLVEMGCLTNPERERKYQEESFMESLAQMLFEVLAEFMGVDVG